MSARVVLPSLQAATFVGLGVMLIAEGHVRLGLAQLALAAVQGLVYA